MNKNQNQKTIAQELFERAKTDLDFLKNIITGDETWVYGYDVETKRQSSQWKSSNSPRPKKARQARSNVKTMLITFFDFRGIVHREWVPQEQTVNQHFYLEVMKMLGRKGQKVGKVVLGCCITIRPRLTTHLSVLSKKSNSSSSTTTILTRLGSVRLFFISKVKIYAHRTSFSNN